MSWHLVKVFVPRIGKVLVLGTEVTDEHLDSVEKRAKEMGHDREWARMAAAVDSVRINLERDGVIRGLPMGTRPEDHVEWLQCRVREVREITYEELLELQRQYSRRKY